jgi:hypothetical protein
MVVGNESLQSDSQLMKVVSALDSSRSFPDPADRRQQKRGKNTDDGQDNQKFSQRKRRLDPWPQIRIKPPR